MKKFKCLKIKLNKNENENENEKLNLKNNKNILNEFENILNEIDYEYTQIQQINRKINNALKVSNHILNSIHNSNLNEDDILLMNQSEQELFEILQNYENARERFDRLSFGIESLSQIKFFIHFLTNGNIPKIEEFRICNDEEYIGSVLNFTQELAKYCSTCALEEDRETVLFCQSFVNSLNGILLEFFFRNGPLRRKFDSLKYTVKKIDSIVFDLSMMNSSITSIATEEENIPSLLGKRSLNESQQDQEQKEDKVNEIENENENGNHVYFDRENFNLIKTRLNNYDQQRETVIKKSRDIQKFSKQAIFSLHGKRFKEAKDKLNTGKIIAEEIKPILSEAYSLRGGSFSNSIEEWIEALLLQEWLINKQILTRQLIENELNQSITISEYIGGLSDLTGELGRLAVFYGTSRDISSLLSIHQVCNLILHGLQDITLSTGKYNQKTTTTRQNVIKIEGLVYEVTMVLKGSTRQTRPLDDIESNGNTNIATKNNVDEEEI